MQFFHNQEIMVVKVPYFLELSSTRVFKVAIAHPTFRHYLPDYQHEKPINRSYLFNVS